MYSSGDFKQKRTCPISLQSTDWYTFHKSFPSLFFVSFTFDILYGPSCTSQVICCSQYLSSQQAKSVGEKFPSQIKWSEIKMLPQHVPWLVTLKEIGPLTALAGAPQSPKTTKTQFDCIQYCDNKAGWLNESQAQFSYVRGLGECCSIVPSHFLLLLWLSVSIKCLTLPPKSISLSVFSRCLTHSQTLCPSCFVLDLKGFSSGLCPPKNMLWLDFDVEAVCFAADTLEL